MLTIVEIRRINLAELVSEAGSQAALSRKVEKDKNQISQWLGKGKARDMDNVTARMFEDVCGKERGWMDNLSHRVRLDAETIRAAISRTKQAIGLVMSDPLDVERDAELLAGAIRTEFAVQLRALEESIKGGGDELGSGSGQVGRIDRAARSKKDGSTSQPAPNRQRKPARTKDVVAERHAK